jgi:ligand-binding SRPBCC domain-containing protein
MQLQASQWLPVPLDEVFGFFSDASNLQALTPPWVHFKILTPLPITMQPGTLIDYRIRLRGIPITWQSEISVWDPPHRFVDVQVRGPYTRWVHTHNFAAERGGTTITDAVDFDVPLGFVLGWFVKRDVEKIFGYRRQELSRLFGDDVQHRTR